MKECLIKKEKSNVRLLFLPLPRPRRLCSFGSHANQKSSQRPGSPQRAATSSGGAAVVMATDERERHLRPSWIKVLHVARAHALNTRTRLEVIARKWHSGVALWGFHGFGAQRGLIISQPSSGLLVPNGPSRPWILSASESSTFSRRTCVYLIICVPVRLYLYI